MAKSKGIRVHRASQEAYAEFVKAWNGSETREDAISASGLPPSTAGAWAGRLRKAGVSLRKFTRKGVPIDVKALNEIAKKAIGK